MLQELWDEAKHAGKLALASYFRWILNLSGLDKAKEALFLEKKITSSISLFMKATITGTHSR